MRNAKGWAAICLLLLMVAIGCARQGPVDQVATTPSTGGGASPTALPSYTRAVSSGAVATNTSTVIAPSDTPVPASPTQATPTETPAPPTATPGPGTPTAAPATSTATPTTTLTPTASPTPTDVPPTSTATDVPEVWETDGRIMAGEYPHQIDAGGVTFRWRTDDTYLYGALSAYTLGWVGIGIEPENQMQGADFIFGYVHGGKAYVADMYGDQPSGSHPPDTDLGGTDDIIDYGGRESDGLTVIEFMIPLDSEDEYDRALVSGERYDVILAWGDQDSFDSYHVTRAWGEIILD